MRVVEHSHTGTPCPDRNPGWTPYRGVAADTVVARIAVAPDTVAALAVVTATGTAAAWAVVAAPGILMVLAAALRAHHRNAANEIATGRVTLEVTLARKATVAREQRARVALEEHTAPDHIATHNTAAAVALEHPAEAEVCIVLRFPRYSLNFCLLASTYAGLCRAHERVGAGTGRVKAQHHTVPGTAQIRVKAYHNSPAFTNLPPKVIGKSITRARSHSETSALLGH